MGWITRLAFVFFFTCMQIYSASGASADVWGNPATAEGLLQAFTQQLQASGAFSYDQMDDISSISDTIMDAIERSARSNKSSKSKLQALNMAFASSVAEIAASGQGGQPLSVKTGAIIDALASAFLQTTGAVDQVFLNEMNELITMFTQASANEVSSSSAAAAAGAGYGAGGQGQGSAAAAAASAAGTG
ncbi:hypothetical protein X975_05132, partial [Stegodyphus mimosarum]